MRIGTSLGIVAVTTLAVGLSLAAAPPPELLHYQGFLRNLNGPPVPDGSYAMEFCFYDAQSGGTLLLCDQHGGVPTVDGVFSTELGAGTLTPGIYSGLGAMFTAESEVWMEIEIETEILSGRVHVRSAAYALGALDAATSEDLDCIDCVDATEVFFTYAGSTSKGGPAVNLQCTDCVASGEIEDLAIVNADISASAEIAPSKISGTAWTSTNDGAGSGLDADLLDTYTATDFPRILERGQLPPFTATSHVLTIPHDKLWTLYLASGWPQHGGLATITGFENDWSVSITYTKYNGDGTSESGGAECYESSTDNLLTFGSGSHVYYLDCPGENTGDHNLVLAQPASAVELNYSLLRVQY